MVELLEFSRSRRAKVWLDEDLPAHFSATSVVTKLVQPKVIVDVSRRTAGVELRIPHGPVTSYALLGAELTQSNVGGLEIIVSVNNAGLPFHPSLVNNGDAVKVGLPSEYASGVISGASTVAETIGAPTGVALRFRWAAHDLVGSSEAAFAMASAIVLQLLMLPIDASHDRVRALFP